MKEKSGNGELKTRTGKQEPENKNRETRIEKLKMKIKIKQKVGDNHGAVSGNRNELCGMQCQSGKSSFQGSGSDILFCQFTNKLHGSRRNGGSR